MPGVQRGDHRHEAAIVAQLDGIALLDTQTLRVLGIQTYDGIRLELFHVLDIPPLHMSARSQVVGAYAERMLCARGTVNVRFQSGFPVQEGLVLRLIDFLANVVRRNDLLLIESGALGGRGERTAFEGNVRLPRQEARRFLFFQFLERDPQIACGIAIEPKLDKIL